MKTSKQMFTYHSLSFLLPGAQFRLLQPLDYAGFLTGLFDPSFFCQNDYSCTLLSKNYYFFKNKDLLCNPGWQGIFYIDQADFQLTEIPLSLTPKGYY